MITDTNIKSKFKNTIANNLPSITRNQVNNIRLGTILEFNKNTGLAVVRINSLNRDLPNVKVQTGFYNILPGDLCYLVSDDSKFSFNVKAIVFNGRTNPVDPDYMARKIIDMGAFLDASFNRADTNTLEILNGQYVDEVRPGLAIELNDGGMVKYGYLSGVSENNDGNRLARVILNDIGGSINQLSGSDISNVYMSSSGGFRSHPQWINIGSTFVGASPMGLTAYNSSLTQLSIVNKEASIKFRVTFRTGLSIQNRVVMDSPTVSGETNIAGVVFGVAGFLTDTNRPLPTSLSWMQTQGNEIRVFNAGITNYGASSLVDIRGQINYKVGS